MEFTRKCIHLADAFLLPRPQGLGCWCLRVCRSEDPRLWRKCYYGKCIWHFRSTLSCFAASPKYRHLYHSQVRSTGSALSVV